jgi:hypothetical protein
MLQNDYFWKQVGQSAFRDPTEFVSSFSMAGENGSVFDLEIPYVRAEPVACRQTDNQ